MKRAKSQRAQDRRIHRLIRDIVPKAFAAAFIRCLSEAFERELIGRRERV
jgi:hypothetical protein